MNEQLVKLEQMLKTHDWYYQMSDDHKMYTKGHNERKAAQYFAGVIAAINA